jgi:hypothetical protein
VSCPPETPFTCVTCEAEIVGQPTFYVGLPFCCAGCVADGPCICSYDQEPVGTTTTPVEPRPELVGIHG